MEKTLFLKKISDYINANALLKKDDDILIALSGGADSVALLLSLIHLGYKCKAAHCNFHLRGEESMRDERFVRTLTKKLDIPLFHIDFDVPKFMKENHMSLEMACRKLRYDWFENLRQKENYKVLAVGHHSDDNIETFFLNTIRGSGINGLSAIKPRNGYIIRPLLCVSRNNIEAFLTNCNQDYIIDSTNNSIDYNRNKVRNIIIPQICELFPQQALLKTIENLSACNEFYQGAIEEAINKCVFMKNEYTIIDMTKIIKYPGAETLLYEIVKRYNFNPTQSSEIFNTFHTAHSTGRYFISSTHNAIINRDSIEISQKEPISNNTEYDINLSDISDTLPLDLTITYFDSIENIRFTRDPYIAYFNSNVLNCKLTLRKWKNGDSMIQFGMKGRKKLSDIFSDAKLSLTEKEKIWILEADGEIIWIIGLRTSNKYRCTKDDKIIQIKASLR